MQWIQPNNRPWRRAALYLIIGLALLIGQFFLWPQVSLLAQQWQEARLQGQQLNTLRQKVFELEKKFSADQPIFEQLTAIAPAEEQTAQLIERLESVAQLQRVTAQTQSISEEQGDKIKPVVFIVQATGSATSLLNYMAALEHLPELATIRSWKIVPQTAAANQPPGTNVSYTLSMNIIFYLQPQTPKL